MALPAGMIQARTLYVSPAGTNDYTNYYPDWAGAATTISAAVSRAAANDVVMATNETYMLTASIVITNSILVRSWNNGNLDPENTILNGNGMCAPLYVNKLYSAAPAGSMPMVAGFTITNGNGLGGNFANSGGGVELGYDVNFGGILSNCIVAGNSADTRGGGIYMAGLYALVTDCRVINNTVTNPSVSAYGGGIYNYIGTISNCGMIAWNNVRSISGSGGGAYFATGGKMIGCLVTNNTATNNGGGLFLYTISPSYGATLRSNTVSGNRCAAGAGGGIYIYFSTSNCLVSDCTVNGNSSVSGGGIGVYVANDGQGAQIRDCMVAYNNANEGGGIYASYNGNDRYYYVQVSNCTVVGNTGRDGGGMHFYAAGFAESCTIVSNIAATGGGIYFRGAMTTVPFARNCLIAGNRATNNGGGVASAAINLINCTLASNLATNNGGGIYNSGYGAASYLTNTISYFNSAASGSNWFINASGGGGTIYCVNTCIAPASGTGLNASNSMDSPPLFVDRDAFDFHHGRNSPTLNRGVNQAWMENTFDLDGSRRLDRFSGIVDMGCYEYLPSGFMFKIF